MGPEHNDKIVGRIHGLLSPRRPLDLSIYFGNPYRNRVV